MKKIILFAAVTFLAASSFALDYFRRNNLVLPRTLLGDVTLSGMSRDEARDAVRQRLEMFVKEPFQISARGNTEEFTLEELGVSLNEAGFMAAIPFAGNFSAPEMALWSMAGQRIDPRIQISSADLLRMIQKKFPDIPAARNASFVRNGNRTEIREAQQGVAPKIPPLLQQLKQNIVFLEHLPLRVEFEEMVPSVYASDLEAYRDRIFVSLPQSLDLLHEEKKYPVDFAQYPERISFSKKNYEVEQDELPFSLSWDPVDFSRFVSDKLSGELEQSPEDVRIFSQNGVPVAEGRGNEGRAIDRDRLLVLANQAINNGTSSVELPLLVLPPKVEVSEDLQALGIRELVGVGHTRFAGSPINRKHNIGVGVLKFNGLLIPPGETFSFNKNLGEVDETTGYRKELVIKPEGTIPEFGGGLCQVSSTLYRAVIFSGLPIVERSPHSYAVTYYSQIGGHGLDATIYPPARDLRFVNDTPGHIFIQSYVDGVDAFFKFYGTSDGRKVEMEGPFISNRRSAPAEIVTVPDPSLKSGEKKQVEKPHNGFDTLWYRSIIKGGDIVKEEIVSRYKAMPAKFLVGGPVQPAANAAGAGLPEANPFE